MNKFTNGTPVPLNPDGTYVHVEILCCPLGGLWDAEGNPQVMQATLIHALPPGDGADAMTTAGPVILGNCLLKSDSGVC